MYELVDLGRLERLENADVGNCLCEGCGATGNVDEVWWFGNTESVDFCPVCIGEMGPETVAFFAFMTRNLL